MVSEEIKSLLTAVRLLRTRASICADPSDAEFFTRHADRIEASLHPKGGRQR